MVIFPPKNLVVSFLFVCLPCGLEQSGSSSGSFPEGRRFESCTRNIIHVGSECFPMGKSP